ncbi:MAG: hypothetical protein HC889_00610 [Synechococcaceae cyanobacterium SM1_2_3]|nr:hypothetical protein [Synechococcaceae cyanobacterium SM1_2_3]
MKTHLAVVGKSAFGATLTTTLCGRMSGKSTDGMNSDESRAAVTCKHCQAILKDANHWRFRKYLKGE